MLEEILLLVHVPILPRSSPFVEHFRGMVQEMLVEFLRDLTALYQFHELIFSQKLSPTLLIYLIGFRFFSPPYID
jgi:hypothetical protein